ncbi:MAG: hypothetical protein J6334_08610, partial [Kiritimatiellae bacterium]|nr:hypothetical protein [Kiritimatiellia bacterium]
DFDFLFSTKFYDPDIGMYYYGYRYYSPELRRWAIRDPIGEEGGLNLYGFCGNDGVNGNDPIGEFIVRPVANSPRETVDADGWLNALWISVFIFPDEGKNSVGGNIFHVKRMTIDLTDCLTGEQYQPQTENVQKRFPAYKKTWTAHIKESPQYEPKPILTTPFYINIAHMTDIKKCVKGSITINSYFKKYTKITEIPPMGEPTRDLLSGSLDHHPKHGSIPATKFLGDSYDGDAFFSVVMTFQCERPYYSINVQHSDNVLTDKKVIRYRREDDEKGSSGYYD